MLCLYINSSQTIFKISLMISCFDPRVTLGVCCLICMYFLLLFIPFEFPKFPSVIVEFPSFEIEEKILMMSPFKIFETHFMA